MIVHLLAVWVPAVAISLVTFVAAVAVRPRSLPRGRYRARGLRPIPTPRGGW